MIEFVFMLTHHDRTVDQPGDVYREIRGCGLRYVGFKDVGASVAELREVCGQAHDDGLDVMLEVVSTSKEDELRSLAAAMDAPSPGLATLPPASRTISAASPESAATIDLPAASVSKTFDGMNLSKIASGRRHTTHASEAA